jgi:hypothetical protein
MAMACACCALEPQRLAELDRLLAEGTVGRKALSKRFGPSATSMLRHRRANHAARNAPLVEPEPPPQLMFVAKNFQNSAFSDHHFTAGEKVIGAWEITRLREAGVPLREPTPDELKNFLKQREISEREKRAREKVQEALREQREREAVKVEPLRVPALEEARRLVLDDRALDRAKALLRAALGAAVKAGVEWKAANHTFGEIDRAAATLPYPEQLIRLTEGVNELRELPGARNWMALKHESSLPPATVPVVPGIRQTIQALRDVGVHVFLDAAEKLAVDVDGGRLDPATEAMINSRKGELIHHLKANRRVIE